MSLPGSKLQSNRSPASSNLSFFQGAHELKAIYSLGGIFTAPLQELAIDSLLDDYAKTVAYPSLRQLGTHSGK